LLAAGAAGIVFALPAIGQQGPESLLPPGFGDPAVPPPPATNRPPPPAPAVPGDPATIAATPGATSKNDSATGDQDEKDEDDEDDEEELVIRYDVPPAARRSLSAVGIISEASGGYPGNAFGLTNGAFLQQVLQRTNGPLASRWATIMARRMLASRINTPAGIDGADWTAERARLLLRMGDSVVARQLVQAVDAGRYSKRLHEVAMQAFLANGDLAGMCPLSESGVRMVGDPRWKMSRPICASLSGDQGNATALLNQGRYQGWMKGIDYLLAEKAIGAGINGRRSVKIEWENVDSIDSWRFGLSAATGVQPPERIFAGTGRHVAGWRAQLPMFSAAIRVNSAPGAAALGVLSNRDMVDLYAQLLDDPGGPDAARARAEALASAYNAADEGDKVSAMAGLWDGASEGADYHAMLVLTARSAALIAPSSRHSATADRLIASMMTSGFDRPAAAWGDIVDAGSLGWALLAVGAPAAIPASYGALDEFRDNDQSLFGQRSALLLAGLAGLGRVDAETRADFSGDLNVNITRRSNWSVELTAAADRGESGTVALLALAGLQAPDWKRVPASHLYHIVRSLRAVGLEAEARMIATEAVTFG
jgi:hypothetical protein